MANKRLIKKLRDNAELAWAAYGYYDLITNENNDFFIEIKDTKNKNKQDENNDLSRQAISLQDIMNITYKNYEVYKPNPLSTLKPEKVGTLKGDMTPTQAKRFFERYDLLIHQPNTKSGFSATLFKDKTTKQYTLAFLGTELSFNQALKDVATAESASIIKALYAYNVSLESKSVA